MSSEIAAGEARPVVAQDVRDAGAFPYWRLAVMVAAALGVALRVRAYAGDRSLWLDEAMLALNICGRSFAGLLRPLDFGQGAPIGFLMLERLAVVALGPTEQALRLVPFLASIATLWLVYRFCRANLGAGAAVLGVALTAVTPALIWYAGEAKQYGLDVAVGLGVLNAGADALREGVTRRRAVVLAVVGAVGVWLSHPAVFVLAGVGTTVVWRAVVARRWSECLTVSGIATVWLASFLANYILFLKGLNSDAGLNEFWGSAFLPFPPRSVRDLRQTVAVLLGLFEAPFQHMQVDEGLAARMGLVMAVAWLAGVGLLWRRRAERGRLALLIVPLAFALLAAMLHKYPLRFRLALFTTGPILLVITTGLTRLLRSREATQRVLGRVLLAGVALLPLLHASQVLARKPEPYGARTVLAQMARQWRPGDVVLVDDCSAPSFRYYQLYDRIEGLDRVAVTQTSLELQGPATLARLVREHAGSRVWLVFSSHLPDPGGRELRSLLVLAEQSGPRLASVEARGYSAHLFRFTTGGRSVKAN